MQSTQFNLEDSNGQDLNANQWQMFVNFQQDISQEHHLCSLEKNKSNYSSHQNTCQFLPQQHSAQSSPQTKLKRKKTLNFYKGKTKADYTKNICGYVVRKAIRQLTLPTFKDKIIQLCRQHKYPYERVRQFYLGKMQRVTGPSHLYNLLIPDNQSEKTIKTIFGKYLLWFLRERYIRYLLTEGKMEMKYLYIQEKNKKIIKRIEEILQSIE